MKFTLSRYQYLQFSYHPFSLYLGEGYILYVIATPGAEKPVCAGDSVSASSGFGDETFHACMLLLHLV